jgi:hypothetical protein
MIKQFKVLTDDKVIVPFFNKKINVVRGLDPLGLQNSSVRAYSLLLPGLNNVTGKVQYYSFYCWLFQQYYILNKSADENNLKRFIRFAEYTIALLSQMETEDLKKVQAIPGSNYAFRQLEDGVFKHQLKQHTFNLTETVETPKKKVIDYKSTEKTYWKYKFGAFGQYYLGALRDLGLVHDYYSLYDIWKKDGNQHITGEHLAAIYDNKVSMVSKELRECFLAQINDEEGYFDNKKLAELKRVFDFSKIKDEAERTLLIDLFLQTDYPLDESNQQTYYRRATIANLLQFLNKGDVLLTNFRADRAFTIYAYEQKGIINNIENPCMLGWYYYQLSEFWQFACTSVLNGLLDILLEVARVNSLPINELLARTVERTMDVISEQFLNYKSIENQTVDAVFSAIKDYPTATDVILDLDKKKVKEKKIALAMLMIYRLYQEDLQHVEKLQSFYMKNELGTYNDFSILIFLQQFNSVYKNLPIETFLVRFIQKYVMYRHQFVAYKKMPSTMSQTTEKFRIEENSIQFLKNFEPSFTGPRISNLLAFLRDLQLLHGLELTEKGSETLQELTQQEHHLIISEPIN